MLRKKRVEHPYHGAFQHADALAGKGGRLRRDAVVIVVLYQAIDLVAHRSLGVGNEPDALLAKRETRQKVNIAIEQHLVEVPIATIDILIVPAGVLRELSIVLVGITGLDGPLLGTLFKDFVLVIANTYRCDVSVIGPRGSGREDDQGEQRHQNRCAYASHCPHEEAPVLGMMSGEQDHPRNSTTPRLSSDCLVSPDMQSG